MKFAVTPQGLKPADPDAAQFVKKLLPGSFVELEYKDRDKGSVSMLRTWRGWMRETARHMAHKGCTMPMYYDSQGNPHGSRPFNEYDAHELFTTTYLGCDEEGRRKSWSMSGDPDTVQASKRDRLWAMDRHVEWAAERGIRLTIPQRGEYIEERKKAQREAA